MAVSSCVHELMAMKLTDDLQSTLGCQILFGMCILGCMGNVENFVLNVLTLK